MTSPNLEVPTIHQQTRTYHLYTYLYIYIYKYNTCEATTDEGWGSVLMALSLPLPKTFPLTPLPRLVVGLCVVSSALLLSSLESGLMLLPPLLPPPFMSPRVANVRASLSAEPYLLELPMVDFSSLE